MKVRQGVLPGLLWLAAADLAQAQEPQEAQEPEVARQQTIRVIGSHAGSAQQAGLPLDILDRQALERLGQPRLHDWVRRLGVSSGTDGQSNQYASGWLPGTANINLRGLGAGRSLVLLNGRRLATAPFAIDEQAQSFTDINQIPGKAVSRIEILRSGAAALYGSDAIGGVVNFSTDSDFQGLEFSTQYSGISGSDGDAAFAVKGDWKFGATSVFASVSGDFRGELSTRDRDWAVRPYEHNPNGGWSGLGNPGSFVRTDATGNIASFVPDENCAALGGTRDGAVCRFQFGQFSNLVEETRRWNVFAELRHDFSETLKLRTEMLYADTDLPSYDTSPSLPPRFFYAQSVPSDHPALVAYREANPDWAAAVYGAADPTRTDLLYFGRAFGVSGNPLTGGQGATGERQHRMWRILTELSGELADRFEWDASLSWSGAQSRRTAWDIYREGFAQALLGYGLCSDPITGVRDAGAVAGQGRCEYYNPFSSAIERSVVTGASNPDYDPDLANTPELAEWLFGELRLDSSTNLLEIETRIKGGTGWHLPGGEVGFAAGFQYRRDEYAVRPDDVSDLARNPGDTGAGVYSFLAGAYREDLSRDVYAFYGEFRLRPLNPLEMQLALRIEGYGTQFVSVDPKLSAQWQITPFLAARAGLQTAFRGPTLNQLGGISTSLQYVAPTSAFKAVELYGNPGLKPERSFEVSAGLVFENGPVQASFDYWRIDLRDALFVESYNDIVAAVEATLDAGQPDAAILDRIVFAGATMSASEIASIRTNIINGPSIVTSGLTLRLDWQQQDLWGGTARMGFQADYIFEFRVGAYKIEDITVAGGDFAGQVNASNPFRSQPRWKGQVQVSYSKGAHYWGAVINIVGSYTDERDSTASTYELQGSGDRLIQSWATLDLHYSMEISDALGFRLDIENIADTPPPFAALNVNYDPYTHSPLGRVIRLGLSWKY